MEIHLAVAQSPKAFDNKSSQAKRKKDTRKAIIYLKRSALAREATDSGDSYTKTFERLLKADGWICYAADILTVRHLSHPLKWLSYLWAPADAQKTTICLAWHSLGVRRAAAVLVRRSNEEEFAVICEWRFSLCHSAAWKRWKIVYMEKVGEKICVEKLLDKSNCHFVQ